ncbi:hypothetical protein F5Y19DRAFT_480467 [Xylariaceae sp. FL1651]|nr:hypothetical protein F5Y19DRAFT_480467 [Xylariaceae sp. FL1651]
MPERPIFPWYDGSDLHPAGIPSPVAVEALKSQCRGKTIPFGPTSPWTRAAGTISKYNNERNRDITYYDHRDYTSEKRAPRRSTLDNKRASGLPNSSLFLSVANVPLPIATSPEPYTPQDTTFDAAATEALLVMTGAHIPPPHPKSHPYHPLASHPPRAAPAAPSSSFSRDSSTSSLLSLPTRDSSIRIVKPNLALSPPQKVKDKVNKETAVKTMAREPRKDQSATMYPSEYTGQMGADHSQSRGPAMRQHSHSESQTQARRKKSLDTPEGYSRSRDNSVGAGPTAKSSGKQSGSADRGRTMQRRYEFIGSDDDGGGLLSPVQETVNHNTNNGNGSNSNGRESNMTTVTGLIQQGMRSSPPKPPVRQHYQQQQGGVSVTTSAAQPSRPQPTLRRRPAPLDLTNAIRYGQMERRTGRYEFEHFPIKSSRAEYFYAMETSSSVYDDNVEDPLSISPLNIPKRNEMCNVNFLQAYSEWKEASTPISSVSQGSIRVEVPTEEEDTFLAKETKEEDRLRIAEYPVVQEYPLVQHVRSRSTLGFREDRNCEHSGGSEPVTGGSHDMMPSKQGPGMKKSATMNDIHARMELPPSPFTPLTPFLTSDAPRGGERVTKKLFGEHGWLENTATSGAKQPKTGKPGGFIDNLKRKAREIADISSFKQTRITKTNAVNRINISLDAREQSLLYCELEFNLSNALDAYIKAQLNGGRLEADKLKRVADAWAQQGRPKVIGFRYDLETQVDLIAAHINDFRFYGPLQAEGPAAVSGLLHAMKTNARYMRVRTLCQPDSVIAKHVLDAQNFLRLLGSTESLQRPLEEIAQFFKIAVEKQKAIAAAPAARGGSGRAGSNGNEQHKNEEQHARFYNERPIPYAKVPGASKSRADVRDQSFGSAQTQIVKSQSQGRNLGQQRQFSDSTDDGSKIYDSAYR